ncbi:NahX [Pseudomonas fluorescens HK44]|uniref:NahX n=1 Tax=Pseudomonas fluorescens HK44 TaxID=1042209 RepID=A0A010SR71_PSEFL|nr:heme-binding protein [Pseudomonas fluorescens]EXF93538.1 NahX [Pseudomonas fluorescens HK44]
MNQERINQESRNIELQAADPLSLCVAQRALDTALQHAEKNGWLVSVAVLDGGGHLLAFGRGAGAPLHTIDIAQDKALTAVSFGMSTADVGERLRNAPDHVRSCLMLRPRLVPMGGALPFKVGERLVGAIGVSGASEEQDDECAAAGYRAVVLNKQ